MQNTKKKIIRIHQIIIIFKISEYNDISEIDSNQSIQSIEKI